MGGREDEMARMWMNEIMDICTRVRVSSGRQCRKSLDIHETH